MKTKLSIIVPGIRIDRWEAVYRSIQASTTRPWEIIIISPYALPNPLYGLGNVKYIRDYGHPVRCSNMGLLLAEGELLTWNADDGNFLPGMIDKAVDALEGMPSNPKNVLVCKYQEGPPVTQPDSYYRLCNAYPKSPYAPEDWWIFNLVITKTDYFKQLGGWDSSFETLAISHADMAMRGQRDGCITQLFPEAIVHNSHGHADHRLVEIAHGGHDDPLYREIYGNESCLTRTNIDINNWMSAPTIWTRRFSIPPNCLP